MAFDRKNIFFYLLLICTVIEVLCCTYYLNLEHKQPELPSTASLAQVMHHNLTSIWYFIAGLAISIIPMLSVRNSKPSQSSYAPNWLKWALPITVLLFGALCMRAGYDLFIAQPVDYHNADMLPVIKVMNERWINHEEVYAIITQFYDGEKPVYLPAMWMSFSPSILLHFDMRYITLGGVLVGILLVMFSIKPKRWNWQSLLALLPFMYLTYFLITSTDYFRWTEEGVVVCFYLFLAYAIMKRNFWLQGIAISLCLLSRFSFAGWVPMFFVVSFFFGSKKHTVFTAFVTLGFTLMLLIWSQAITNLPFLLNLHDHYMNALNEPNNRWIHESTIREGLGMAKFIPYTALIGMQKVLMGITIAFPIVGYSIYRWVKNINKEYFLLAMLKLYLVIFYNLLILPYTYLFFTSTFISCFIVYRYSKRPDWHVS